eukprot:TRINITY_DN3650_c0_g1_i1.p1 TRINITY_DN3650_c0_g1~~TRINITY_DN3650_c0_g1_i1.p1  ORF type:complete len:395 (+),score=77.09 TRINITY_DN3650_c0_g1_i1:399-1583(+)
MIMNENSLCDLQQFDSFAVRTIWTIILLVGFIAILWAGHIYCVLIVFLLTLGIFKEILSLKKNKEKDGQVPFSSTLNWYFFGVAVFFFFGKMLSSKLTRFVLENVIVYRIVSYHSLICFMLYIGGFLLFVLSLKKGYYRYQFAQYGWTHITCLLIVAQTSAMINNIYEGLIWFILPCILVITNDIMAYIFGVRWGKTKLIELSPKKTWEGFIGGFFSTIVLAYLGSHYLAVNQYLICPQDELTFNVFDTLECQRSPIFDHQSYNLPSIFHYIGLKHFVISEFEGHAIIMGMFASLISPFGGFFASGFKRAIKIKDFADVIPGHGGLTDRMDCQILMGTFSYLYVHQVIFGRMANISNLTRFIATLSSGDQLLLYRELEKILMSKKLLNATIPPI